MSHSNEPQFNAAEAPIDAAEIDDSVAELQEPEAAISETVQPSIPEGVKRVFTFGSGQPCGPGCIVIEAPNQDEARLLMFQRFGRTWSFEYPYERLPELVASEGRELFWDGFRSVVYSLWNPNLPDDISNRVYQCPLCGKFLFSGFPATYVRQCHSQACSDKLHGIHLEFGWEKG